MEKNKTRNPDQYYKNIKMKNGDFKNMFRSYVPF